MTWGTVDHGEEYRLEIPERLALQRAPRLDGDSPTTAPEPTGASRTIYLLLGIVPLVLVATVLFAQTGIISTSARTSRTPWDLSLIFLSLLIILGMGAIVSARAPELLRRVRLGGFDEDLARWELRVTYVSLPLAGACALTATLAYVRAVDELALGPMAAPVLSALAILATCTPFACFSAMRTHRVRELEESFPDFLRDLNEAHSAGMTMAHSLRVAGRGDYGRLNKEIRLMVNQVSWGMSFTESLRLFSARLGTPVIRRSATLIIKATQAGGNVRDVLMAASRDARELKALEHDRRVNMTLYLIVIYVAFGVFLAVTAALKGLLIPAILLSTQAVGGGSIGGITLGNNLTLTDFRHIYFAVGIVQAFGSGIVAGAMAEGSLASGLKHSAVLVAVTIVVLGIL